MNVTLGRSAGTQEELKHPEHAQEGSNYSLEQETNKSNKKKKSQTTTVCVISLDRPIDQDQHGKHNRELDMQPLSDKDKETVLQLAVLGRAPALWPLKGLPRYFHPRQQINLKINRN